MPMTNTAIRLDDDELELVDAMVGVISAAPEFLGVTINRSVVIRMCLKRGLAALVETYGDPREPRRSRSRKKKRRRNP